MFSSSWQARLSRSLSTDMGFNIGFLSSSHTCGQLNIHVNSIVVLLNLDLLPYILKIGHCRLKGRGLGICYSTFPPVPLWKTYYGTSILRLGRLVQGPISLQIVHSQIESMIPSSVTFQSEASNTWNSTRRLYSHTRFTRGWNLPQLAICLKIKIKQTNKQQQQE